MTTRWESLKEDLICYDYWSSTNYAEWSMIGFFKSLITIDPTKPRREAIQLLEGDLKVLRAAFVDSKESKLITTLLTALRKQNDVLDHFWHASYPTLQRNAISHITNISNVEASMEEEATNRVKGKKRMNSEPQIEGSKRRQAEIAVDTDVGEKDKETEVERNVESDGVVIPNSVDSLGTIIKKEARQLHKLYSQNPNHLSNRDRKLMTAGLSSILDLADQSHSSQRRLFSNEQWDFINQYFDRKLRLKEFPLDAAVINTITIIKNTLDLSNDFDAVKNYVGKMKIKHANDTGCITALNIIKHVLRTMSTYKKMLINNTNINYRENDYFRILWSPLLEILFRPSENVRVVSAESEYQLSINEKKILYPKKKYIHGFKIDIRLVVDIKEEEIDLAIGECAKHNSDAKSIKDEDKLLREAKDAVDGIIQSTSGRDCRLMAYFLQMTGTHCSLSTLDLAKNGLYVAKHRHSYKFPSCVSDLTDFSITLAHLLQMKREVSIAADKVIQARTPSSGSEESFNRLQTHRKNKKLAWMRDTWYSPPRETTSTIPVHMFTLPTPPVFKEVNEDSSDEEPEVIGSADKFGWIQYSNNEYFNIFSKERTTENPYE